MAYFYFDFRDTASHTLAYNIEPSEVVKIQRRGEGGVHTFAIIADQ